MTNSLQQMAARRDAWLSEKPQGGGNNAFFRDGDEIFGWFVANGDDGDAFIKVYRAHTFNFIGANGKRQSPVRYCMVQNGEDGECVYCNQGHAEIKERMALWLYIKTILHSTMPQGTSPDKYPPRIEYQGKYYFNEEINGFRIWEASAWRESPWPDIVKLAEIYKGLHNFAWQMSVTGLQISKRHKVYAIPESEHFPANLYQQAQQECKPIPVWLKEQLAQPVAFNPGQPAAANIPAPMGYNPVVSAPATAAPFQPFNSTSIAATPVSSTPFNPFASASPAPPAVAVPTTPVPETVTPVPVQETPFEEATQQQDNTPPWENTDDNKPLKSMF